MQEQEFKALLALATDESRRFATEYIKNDLPARNVYCIILSLSNDNPSLTQFDLYLEDAGKIVKYANADTVVKTLLRKGKVPVWIDISVSAVRNRKTVISLLCSGRCSDDPKEFYYQQGGTGPFGIKSPAFPLDYKEGQKFWLPEKDRFLTLNWAKIFGKIN
ncbi:hypothetical protein [Flavihumibacter petaseus]|uniref:Uncharacterized protein n=1 Tax=Flavihumibacter petaseus NBRC 106054 TaxID=1220578 RepID=A0A0E9N634_9BACT|nr:hypothetical protein [Flavihumibacter petaseus]GAO45382.1 hypothetical protein FPE01S_05_00790 [Flavihumibacter petaseus NBRC 106054]